MDTSLTIRPQIGAPSADTVRPVAIEAPAAPSVLPIAKTVPSASGMNATTTDPNLARNGNPPAQSQPTEALARQASPQITREVILASPLDRPPSIAMAKVSALIVEEIGRLAAEGLWSIRLEA